jgi:hypothetical protein
VVVELADGVGEHRLAQHALLPEHRHLRQPTRGPRWCHSGRGRVRHAA